MHALNQVINTSNTSNMKGSGRIGEGNGVTYSQKLPALLMCNQPARTPPNANPAFVGMRIDPAEAGDQPRIAIAYAGV